MDTNDKIMKLAFEQLLLEVEGLKKRLSQQDETIEELRAAIRKTDPMKICINDDLWTTKKVLNYLGICYNTLRSMVEKGLITRIRINQRKYLYSPESIKQYLEGKAKSVQS